jgi:hypothetical protein
MPAKISRRQALATLAARAGTLAAEAKPSAKVGDLKVSLNRRFVTYADGSPFFYLGDTAWELFHRLTREEANLYLDDRAAKRFTVIQAVVLAELDGLHVPNPYGEVPLVDDDPTRPNEKYFAHVDYVVEAARLRGMYVGMLPTWGNKVVKGSWEKSAPVIFNPESAYRYGLFIGRRYQNAANVIWILGGDRDPAGVEAVWRAMARGLKEGDGSRHLITFHPNGRNSSAGKLHDEAWLDFNMIQSGHNMRDNPNYEMIQRDYNRTPVKPCMDGEPRYENHPIDWKPDEKGWFDEHDVRQAAYCAIFAGAHGHTYGCHDVWQMLTAGRQPVGFARGDWKTSIHLPGASQMTHVRSLIESRPMLGRVPDASILASDAGTGGDHILATRGGGYAFVYSPAGKPFSVRMNFARGARELRASWFDPRSGQSHTMEVLKAAGERTFTPPGTPGRGNDWILILDDVEALRRSPDSGERPRARARG